jgi:hypothetical protein
MGDQIKKLLDEKYKKLMKKVFIGNARQIQALWGEWPHYACCCPLNKWHNKNKNQQKDTVILNGTGNTEIFNAENNFI